MSIPTTLHDSLPNEKFTWRHAIPSPQLYFISLRSCVYTPLWSMQEMEYCGRIKTGRLARFRPIAGSTLRERMSNSTMSYLRHLPGG